MPDLPFITLDDGSPRLLWRGESSGELFQTFDLDKTNAGVGFFFTEDRDQAKSYAGLGTAPRAFHLQASRVLDLLDPWAPQLRTFMADYRARHDEWTDRISGEPIDPETLIESGYLYDYEGNGHGNRWNDLFRFASACGYDAVRVLDATDGCVAPVWVVFEPSQIAHVPDPPSPCMVSRRPRP